MLEAFTLNEHGGEGNRGKHPPVKDASKDKEDDSEVKDKEKADLDDDGKLSGYEKKRAKAIEDSMKKQGKKKKKVNEDGTQEKLDSAVNGYLEKNPDATPSQVAKALGFTLANVKDAAAFNAGDDDDDDTGDSKKELQKKAQKWLDNNPDSKKSLKAVEKAIMDNNGKVPKDLKESKRDRMFRKKVRLMIESMNLKSNKRKVTVRKRRK